jgi:hypothetical protein
MGMFAHIFGVADERKAGIKARIKGGKHALPIQLRYKSRIAADA